MTRSLGCRSSRSIPSFFFQAEDGIRDGTVTGVQTCALPICGRDGEGLPVRHGGERRLLPGGAGDPLLRRRRDRLRDGDAGDQGRRRAHPAAPGGAPGRVTAMPQSGGDEPERPQPRLVRPYALTGGRARNLWTSLQLEALLSTTSTATGQMALSPEQRTIAQLCRHHFQSVAEISALLRLPLGVVRVLVGELVDRGVL